MEDAEGEEEDEGASTAGEASPVVEDTADNGSWWQWQRPFRPGVSPVGRSSGLLIVGLALLGSNGAATVRTGHARLTAPATETPLAPAAFTM